MVPTNLVTVMGQAMSRQWDLQWAEGGIDAAGTEALQVDFGWEELGGGLPE